MKKLISHNLLVKLLKSEFGGDDIPIKLHHIVVMDKEQHNLLFYTINWWIVGSYNIHVNINIGRYWGELYKSYVLKHITSIIMNFGKFPLSTDVMVTMGETTLRLCDEKI